MLALHRAERADALLDGLGELLLDRLADPLAPEVVAVPTRGIERWLRQRLAARLGATEGRADGVCANVAFPSPRRLVGDAVARACGIDPAADPWLPSHSVWSLLDVLDGALGEPWLRPLSSHLDGGAPTTDPVRRARRLGSARHLADLFDRYALHRPQMVRAWAHGQSTDGVGRELAPDAAWQAELWRRLAERIGRPDPADRLAGACAALRNEPGLLALPERLALFGLTRLPAGHLEVLRALAAAREVHLFLLHPSPALWQRIAAATAPRATGIRRREDPTAALAANPLLASWGRDARELQLVLAGAGDAVDRHHRIEQPAASLLAAVQADIRGDRAPPGVPLPGRRDDRQALAPDDRSIEVHACHGRARQVEVVRDAILHLLADDPSLEPRDVIVMCPDVETFAPLIEATFGAGETTGGDDEADGASAAGRPPDLRVRLADRSLRQTNPVLGVVAELLELPQRRLTASQVLDLADREPVRRRFGFDDRDLTRIQGWVAQSGIRWGLDAAHRAPFKLDAVSAGTWRAGIDRILMGAAMTEEAQRPFAGVLPLDDVDSGAIDLAGRFAELLDRLHAAVDRLGTTQPVDAWAAAIASAADGLAATGRADAWQRAELDRLLGDVVREASAAGAVNQTPIAVAEMRELLAERMQGRPTRANFRTGQLTICTLAPMRSVPHRVVCLLGLDDGVFPRKAPRDGDDLLLDEPLVGDRDPRMEDRQMLLDALLAASEHLIITYTGNDERTNAARPPAVPVGELLDIVDATVRAGTQATRERVLVRHPLQPFDPRNFTAGALAGGAPWSFDAVTLAGARRLGGPRTQPGPFLGQPLPPPPRGILEIENLVHFAAHPVRAFLRQRLGISLADHFDVVADDLEVELDGLGRWGVGQRLLEARLAGVDARSAMIAEIARGTLPPGILGKPALERVAPLVEGIVAQAQALAAGSPPPVPIDVRIVLGDGRLLSGTIAGVAGNLLRTVTFSRVTAKHRLAAWVRVLALCAAQPERDFGAATVGRHPGAARLSIARIRPPGEGRRDWALGHLEGLVDLFDRGLREPLPLYCETSAAYAQARASGGDGAKGAQSAWTSTWNFDREDKEPEHQLVLGGVRAFDELAAAAARPGESWDAAETTRLGSYAWRLWDGLLAVEELSVR